MDADEVQRWRKQERARLIEARMALAPAARSDAAQAIAAALDLLAGDVRGRTVALYWPFRGEPDLRAWGSGVIARGGVVALPVVIAKAQPLAFRPYAPGCRMERGVWNIPIPADGGPVLPDIVVSPLVGYDGARYRLGYGGGFYDRTLAAMPAKPLVIGVGYEIARMPTIHPQPFDIPMDHIVTDRRPG